MMRSCLIVLTAATLVAGRLYAPPAGARKAHSVTEEAKQAKAELVDAKNVLNDSVKLDDRAKSELKNDPAAAKADAAEAEALFGQAKKEMAEAKDAVKEVKIVKKAQAELSDAKATAADATKLNTRAKEELTKDPKAASEDKAAAKELTKEATKEAKEAKAGLDAERPKHVVAKKNLTEAEQVARLETGMHAIENLRSLFTTSKSDDATKFAEGALSEELSSKNSAVWATIENMVGSVKKTEVAMKGKSTEEQKKLYSSLEDQLDGKAGDLSNITAKVEKKQQTQNEEYLLGLLMSHQKDWSMEKQLNATSRFTQDSPLLTELYKHHNASQPLAPQLAVLMDARAQPKVAAKAAAKLFVQLSSSLRRHHA